MSSISIQINEEHASENVDKVPGGIYLCQCGEDLSCGSCCGFYNFYFESENQFKEVILKRTIAFENVKRDIDSILKFGEEEIVRVESLGEKPYPNFHHCPYSGFMGDDYEKPGCLLHPLAEKNMGADLRGLSYYGGLACASYFCPTYYNVEAERKIAVREAISDWFKYGLIITEDNMINNIFDELDRVRGKKTASKDFTFEASLLLGSLLKIKFEWPFDRKDFHPANYFFKDTDKKEEENSILLNSRFYHILNAVKASIINEKELEEAEEFILSKILKLADALET